MGAIIHCLLALLAFFHAPPATDPPERPQVRRAAPPRASRGGQRTGLNWAAVRRCESGGRYDRDSGNGFYGAYQAEPRTWAGVWRRHGRPDLAAMNPAKASPADQDEFARLLYAERGAQPWPVCGAHL